MKFEGYNIHMDKLGYPRIWVRGKGLQLIHRLVYARAHGEIPSSLDVHHLDGDKMNWALENLVAITHEEHMQIHRKEALRQKGIDPDKYSICWDCKRTLSRENFCQDKHRGDGLGRRCKECQSAYTKSYNQKNKDIRSEKSKARHAAIKADPVRWKEHQERARRNYLVRKEAKRNLSEN